MPLMFALVPLSLAVSRLKRTEDQQLKLCRVCVKAARIIALSMCSHGEGKKPMARMPAAWGRTPYTRFEFHARAAER
jgi:hypothetical protein